MTRRIPLLTEGIALLAVTARCLTIADYRVRSAAPPAAGIQPIQRQGRQNRSFDKGIARLW